MLPVALDVKLVRVGLAGGGALADRRLAALRKAGAEDVAVFAPEALPDAAALHDLQMLFIVGLEPTAATALARLARSLRVLVNVEDVPALCDFHSVAEVRRGDLLLTVSTGGAAPGLAGSIRRGLEACFAPVWAERVGQVAALRQGWKEEGVAMPEAARRIEGIVNEGCWLNCPRPN